MSHPQMLVFGPKRGRRPRAEAAAGTALRTRLSPAERERVETAAKLNHQTLSEFMRDALVTAADDCIEDTKG